MTNKGNHTHTDNRKDTPKGMLASRFTPPKQNAYTHSYDTSRDHRIDSIILYAFTQMQGREYTVETLLCHIVTRRTILKKNLQHFAFAVFLIYSCQRLHIPLNATLPLPPVDNKHDSFLTLDA